MIVFHSTFRAFAGILKSVDEPFVMAYAVVVWRLIFSLVGDKFTHLHGVTCQETNINSSNAARI
jgi:hypothetical protein